MVSKKEKEKIEMLLRNEELPQECTINVKVENHTLRNIAIFFLILYSSIAIGVLLYLHYLFSFLP